MAVLEMCNRKPCTNASKMVKQSCRCGRINNWLVMVYVLKNAEILLQAHNIPAFIVSLIKRTRITLLMFNGICYI